MAEAYSIVKTVFDFIKSIFELIAGFFTGTTEEETTEIETDALVIVKTED